MTLAAPNLAELEVANATTTARREPPRIESTESPLGNVITIDDDVAPNVYPAVMGVWRSMLPSWALMTAVYGAAPSM